MFCYYTEKYKWNMTWNQFWPIQQQQPVFKACIMSGRYADTNLYSPAQQTLQLLTSHGESENCSIYYIAYQFHFSIIFNLYFYFKPSFFSFSFKYFIEIYIILSSTRLTHHYSYLVDLVLAMIMCRIILNHIK